MLWKYEDVDPNQRDSLAKACAVSNRVAELLIKRGIDTIEGAKEFLSPLLSTLSDPLAIKNLPEAVERLIEAIENNQRVLVFGDYDVDGVTSTTLLVSLLNRFNLDAHPLVPRRMEEGYGLSTEAIERALGEYMPDLFVAVDCGTNSVDEVAYLRAKGIDVIIIDHHTGKHDALPDAILVNPHVHDAPDAPWLHLCSVGLVFKLAHGLIKLTRNHNIDIKDYLDIVAAGTIADMVPLKRENRILAKAGLLRLPNTRRLGLSKLFEVSGMQLGDEVKPFDISFRLGPRINASGRLADASLPIQMLLSHDPQFCQKAAQQLDDYNRERQEIERAIYEQAKQMIDPERFGHVLFDPSWHSGVVGVVSSRLTHEFYRPCLVLGGEGELAKGSGRSVEGVNLVDSLGDCKELLSSWGGHPMAVGVSLDPKNVPAFAEAFDKAVRTRLDGQLPERSIELSAWLTPDEINNQIMEQLDSLRPFGIENPIPIFGLKRTQLVAAAIPFGQNHFRFQIGLPKHRSIWGVAWNKASRIPPDDRPIDLAFELGWNRWKGRNYLQITLIDWKESE